MPQHTNVMPTGNPMPRLIPNQNIECGTRPPLLAVERVECLQSSFFGSLPTLVQLLHAPPTARVEACRRQPTGGEHGGGRTVHSEHHFWGGHWHSCFETLQVETQTRTSTHPIGLRSPMLPGLCQELFHTLCGPRFVPFCKVAANASDGAFDGESNYHG